MSDTTQGPGWWQASDGKWYPPALPRWEYRAIRVGAPDGNEVVQRNAAAKEQGWTPLQSHTAISSKFIGWLNELGEQGWEAIGMAPDIGTLPGDWGSKNQGVYTILFKRLKVPQLVP